MSSKIPLMEGERGAVPFIVNRTKPFVKEDRNGLSFTRIPGRFSICDCINGNNRRYPKKVWEKNLAEGSVLRQAIAKNAAFGLLEHPADGRISLQSPICILVTDAKLQAAQDESTKKAIDEVVGEIIVLETAEGQKLRALIDVGYNPLVSSRGFGSVVKVQDGVDEVQEDYVCEGWDVVLRPSFEKAELRPARESKQESKPLAEGVTAMKFLAQLESGYGFPPQDRTGTPSMGPRGVNEPMPAPAPQAGAGATASPELERFKELAIRHYNETGQNGEAVWAEWEQSGQLNDPEFLSLLANDERERSGQGRDWRETPPANPNSAAGRMPPAAPHDWQGDPGDPRQHPANPNESKNLPQVSSPAAPAAAPVAASHKQPMTERVMTINEIKSRIGAVRGTGVPKDPTRFAEGMNEMAAIHQEIANYVAEDAKRDWQGKQLHDDVSRLERTWSETAQAPAKTATKLTENYSKVLKVTKALGEAALSIRKRLAESLSHNAEAAKLIEELTERGQAWVALADKRKESLAALEHKLEVACEALDIIKNRYNEDMTEMGRHVITLEFKEKAQTHEIQKALKEATKPKDIIAIREQLDPEAAAKAKQEAAKYCVKCKKTPCCCEATQEGKKPAATPAPAVQEGNNSAPAETEPRVLVPSVRSISESVAMVQRLSGTAEKPKEAAAAPAK